MLRPLARELSPGFGGRGHRFAEGWGPGGRNHGWFGHEGWFGHGGQDGKGGPNTHDNGDEDGGPAQSEPDKKG